MKQAISNPMEAAQCARDPDAAFEELVYLLSHDMKNCARALIELPSWIEEDLEEAGHRVDQTVQGHLTLLKTQAKRMDQMLEDLLTYSRVGRFQNSEVSNISECLDQVRHGLSAKAQSTLGVRLDIDSLPIGDKDATVLLDALISNSLKHAPRDDMRIAVRAFDEPAVCVLEVCDNGPGIPAEKHDHVLKCMTTLKSRDEVEGSGMGLAIVQKIVGHYQGELHISTPHLGHGTRIRCAFPRLKGAIETVDQDRANTPKIEGKSGVV